MNRKTIKMQRRDLLKAGVGTAAAAAASVAALVTSESNGSRATDRGFLGQRHQANRLSGEKPPARSRDDKAVATLRRAGLHYTPDSLSAAARSQVPRWRILRLQ